jgi:hypothetical protein
MIQSTTKISHYWKAGKYGKVAGKCWKEIRSILSIQSIRMEIGHFADMAKLPTGLLSIMLLCINSEVCVIKN